MRVHRKGWTYTNFHLSLPIVIEHVDVLSSYLNLTVLYLNLFTRGNTSFDIKSLKLLNDNLRGSDQHQ